MCVGGGGGGEGGGGGGIKQMSEASIYVCACKVYLRPDVIIDEAARLGEVFKQLVYVDLEVLL